MAVIKSGATADELTIDPTSKAARITLYDSAGNELHKEPNGSYLLRIPNARLTAAIAANSAIWTVRNGSSRTMRIKRISVSAKFDGTAAATTAQFQLQRFTTATPSGGTALTAVKKRTALGSSTIADARFNYAAALTVTGVVFEEAFFEWGVQRQVSAVSNHDLLAGLETQEALIELAPNEGLAIRLGVVAVIGDALGGYVEWDE